MAKRAGGDDPDDYALLQSLYSRAVINEEEIAKSIEALDEAIEEVRRAAKALPAVVSGRIEETLSRAADVAASQIVAKQMSTNTQAELAYRAYANAARF